MPCSALCKKKNKSGPSCLGEISLWWFSLSHRSGKILSLVILIWSPMNNPPVPGFEGLLSCGGGESSCSLHPLLCSAPKRKRGPRAIYYSYYYLNKNIYEFTAHTMSKSWSSSSSIFKVRKSATFQLNVVSECPLPLTTLFKKFVNKMIRKASLVGQHIIIPGLEASHVIIALCFFSVFYALLYYAVTTIGGTLGVRSFDICAAFSGLVCLCAFLRWAGFVRVMTREEEARRARLHPIEAFHERLCDVFFFGTFPLWLLWTFETPRLLCAFALTWGMFYLPIVPADSPLALGTNNE